jgi:hypothetical protein
LGQFRYFDQQLGKPVWGGKRVLDFGGNWGNVLRDPIATIDHDKYWCIDVSPDAISEGKKAFPDAHWIFYNRHNIQFNPNGIRSLSIPRIAAEFDFILAYSVFTHTSKAEMMEMVDELSGLLSDRGKLAFTFLDPEWKAFDGDPFPGSNLKWRLQVNKDDYPSIDVDSLLEKARGARWITLLADQMYLNDEGEQEPENWYHGETAYHVLCNPAYMKTIFPKAEILSPVEPERQHCCIIRRG